MNSEYKLSKICSASLMRRQTSHAKYSVEFNDLANKCVSAPNTVFEAVRQTLHILYMGTKVYGQTMVSKVSSKSVLAGAILVIIYSYSLKS